MTSEFTQINGLLAGIGMRCTLLFDGQEANQHITVNNRLNAGYEDIENAQMNLLILDTVTATIDHDNKVLSYVRDQIVFTQEVWQHGERFLFPK